MRSISPSIILTALRSQVAQNIITNYIAVVWMGGLGIALLPIYYKILGPENWGVVAICIATQGFLGLLDAGLSQIMPRNIVRAGNEKDNLAKLFRLFSNSYFGLAILGFLVGQLTVGLFAKYWVAEGGNIGSEIELALRLMLFQFVFQFSNNANTGYWNGRQQQKLANYRQCFFGTLKHILALSSLWNWREDAIGYLTPFIAISAVELISNKIKIQKEIALKYKSRVRFVDYMALMRECGLLIVAVAVGMLVSQLDRIILSRTVNIVDFGKYIVVANLGLAFLHLQYPLMRAVYPRIALQQNNSTDKAIKLLPYAIVIFCITPCIITTIFAPWVLYAWTKDEQLVSAGVLPLRLILSAVAINSIYNLIYHHMLARGGGAVILKINLGTLAITAPILIFIADDSGIAAGGFAWLLVAILQLTAGVAWIYNSSHNRLK